jgi:uncharacterized protein (DUF169 family)
MPDYRAMEQKILTVTGGKRRPVAISFVDAPPPGVPLLEGTAASSCGYWPLAAAGRVFYTTAVHHQNCPIGGYTHNLLLPETMPQLNQALELMGSIGYVRMEEIPGVFKMEKTYAAVVYAPLGETPVDPSVVLTAGRPAQVMLLAEAANRAGAASKLPLLGRPTCMALPAALAQGMVTSAGCIGNRTYTEIGEDELYVVLRGADLERIAQEIDTIQSANQTLTGYHADRRKRLSTV